MSTTTSPLRQEIILGSDGIFIKRETRESVITRADNAITQCTRLDALCMSNIPMQICANGKDHLMYVAHNSGLNPENAYATVKLPIGFPLPGIKLQDTESNGLCLRPVRHHRDPSVDLITPPHDMYYMNSDYDIYVQIKFNIRDVGTGSAKLQQMNGSPYAYLFGYHKLTGKIVTFNLPNIYDDGRICGGNDFIVPELMERSERIYKIYEYTAYLINQLYESPCNSDLYDQELGDRQIGIERTVQGDFRTLPTSVMQRNDTEYTPSKTFFREITNSNIIDFIQCLTSTQN